MDMVISKYWFPIFYLNFALKFHNLDEIVNLNGTVFKENAVLIYKLCINSISAIFSQHTPGLTTQKFDPKVIEADDNAIEMFRQAKDALRAHMDWEPLQVESGNESLNL